MNIKEFRIGNLLQENNTKEIIEVLKLSKDELFLSGNFKREWQAEPIPLTEEWLLKFGFKSDPYNDQYYLDDFKIECDKTKGFLDLWVVNCRVDLKTVHQLQNIYFALTGKELKVK